MDTNKERLNMRKEITSKMALSILGCSTKTLQRKKKDGEIQSIKKGRIWYFYEDEILSIVEDVKKKQIIYSPNEIIKKQKEKITINAEIEKAGVNLSANSELNEIGLETLQTATKDLIRLGLYEECDKQILFMYALNNQAYNRFFVLAMQSDGICSNEAGNLSVHPYHKTMQYHEKQIMQCMDRLGLNPLSRQKFNVKEKEDYDEMEDILKWTY